MDPKSHETAHSLPLATIKTKLGKEALTWLSEMITPDMTLEFIHAEVKL